MHANKFIAQGTGLSRRAADKAIQDGRVIINGQTAGLGAAILEKDIVTLDGRQITANIKPVTIMFNKPPGYVVSRDGQGHETIYDILPPEYHQLKPVGRLDKYSSGLLLLTNNGQLAFDLTHPSKHKNKVYEVTLNNSLSS